MQCVGLQALLWPFLLHFHIVVQPMSNKQANALLFCFKKLIPKDDVAISHINASL